ncbi:MAG: hypothetical protein M0C28_32760 [Candidatus Moduliflexus flocculans]|nr:hypothetical protein [Candidatus Moduliflexus flocculans]
MYGLHFHIHSRRRWNPIPTAWTSPASSATSRAVPASVPAAVRRFLEQGGWTRRANPAAVDALLQVPVRRGYVARLRVRVRPARPLRRDGGRQRRLRPRRGGARLLRPGRAQVLRGARRRSRGRRTSAGRSRRAPERLAQLFPRQPGAPGPLGDRDHLPGLALLTGPAGLRHGAAAGSAGPGRRPVRRRPNRSPSRSRWPRTSSPARTASARAPPRNAAAALTPPRRDEAGYERWCAAVREVGRFLANHRRDVQFVASLPLPASRAAAPRATWSSSW